MLCCHNTSLPAPTLTTQIGTQFIQIILKIHFNSNTSTILDFDTDIFVEADPAVMTYLNQSYRQLFRHHLQYWLLSLLLASAYCDAQSLTLIVNPQLDVTAISRNKARGIFSMRLREWSNGTPIVVYVLPDNDQLHRDFVQNILTMFPHQLRRHWDRYVYTGIGQAPIEVSNINEMITSVRNTVGAIGYIREETADANIRTIQLN